MKLDRVSRPESVNHLWPRFIMFITKLFSILLATFIFFKIFFVVFFCFFSVSFFFFYRKFSDYSRVITDIRDLFIETTDVGD